MRRQLTYFITILICFLSISPVVNADWCDKGMTIYGFEPVVSGDATFGQIVESAGDVDNDGHPDILVVDTRSASFGMNATANVFSGITGDLIRTYYNSINTIYGVSSFGDYNNDQYDDILVNGVVYSGINGDTLTALGNAFGWGIGAGDCNDDGKYDLIIPNVGYSNLLGRVDLISGANGDTLQSWIGNQSGAYFGQSVAAGDINSDGYPDIIIGQPKYDYYGTDRGRVLVYSGLDGSEIFNQSGDSALHQFGYNVASAGDLDNDGYDDILVGGQFTDGNTAPVKVWAYSGQTGELFYTVSGESYSDEYSSSMAGIGDISNDGYGDFAVGAYRYGNNKGKVYIYSGADGSLLMEVYDRYGTNQKLGASVAGLGDIDGDGDPNFAIGATWAEGPEDPTNDVKLRGAVYTYGCTFPNLECQGYDDFDGDIWSNICDNCKWFQNIAQEDSDADGIGDLCEEDAILPTGINRGIMFWERNWDWSGSHSQLTFDTVLTEGPINFELIPLVQYSSGIREIPWQGPIQYTFVTDAVCSGMITVKLPYLDTNLTAMQEENLQMFQQIDGTWRNITSSSANTLYNTIIGRTYALGNFVIGNCEDSPDTDGDGIGDLCDNCPYGYNPLQEDLDSNGIGDVCEFTQTISAGVDGSVSLYAAVDTVNLNFYMVDQQGDVNLSVSDNGPASGSNFTLFPADPPRYYEISTDAVYSGTISITLRYDDSAMTAAEEALVALWHYDGNAWVDITQVLDTVNNKVTGSTTSLSPFVIGISESPTDVEDQIGFELPNNFTLSQNYPNPFNPTTVVEFSVPTRTNVLIEIFNINGQKVKTLVDGSVGVGRHTVSWDGNNSHGQKVSSGIYLYRFQAGEYINTKKMILLK